MLLKNKKKEKKNTETHTTQSKESRKHLRLVYVMDKIKARIKPVISQLSTRKY